MTAPRPMLFRTARALPSLIFAGGLVLAGYYGMAWRNAPTVTDADIAQSTEVNLGIDLSRMGPQLQPQGEKLERLRAIVRAEVEAELLRETRTAQQRFAAGLVAMVFGASGLVFLFLSDRSRPLR